jgi:N-carbamoyl-L-amino-acid hydrolase
MRAEPIRMSPKIQTAIEGAAGSLGLRTRPMPSGAGHDAQILAAVTDAEVIFVPSEGGRSHRPEAALERGANVRLGTLLPLARADG